MLDFGFSEILLTSAIALVVLGPERLPKVARQVGNWMGRARVMARQLSEQLEREVSAEELLKEQSTPKPSAANRIAPPQADAVAGMDPHAAPHAEYNPPTTVPTTPPSND
jgi:Tat protein translocase TatB subunit